MTMIIDRQKAVTLNPMIRLSMRYYTFMHCEIYSFLLLSIHTHINIYIFVYVFIFYYVIQLLEIPSRAHSQSHLEALTHASEEGDTSSRPEVASHPPPPLNVEPQLEVTAGNTIDGIGVAFLTCNNDVICLNAHFYLIRIHILCGVALVIVGCLVELNKL
ncbi:uncharacterized protein LOC114271084 [Camellia sinensis]|uniref:uncharacterized protein LOC114271084 n=1 Tax=Camellia sinensis TaxID=4442 RepID=UPI0010367961|nr:uncharacterized protein LOC114271084 [Camellia sinensis]